MENLERPKRGFASLSPEQRREIARRGGKTAHEKGRAHRFTSEEARAAGRKGGLASTLKRAQKSLTSQSPELPPDVTQNVVADKDKAA